MIDTGGRTEVTDQDSHRVESDVGAGTEVGRWTSGVELQDNYSVCDDGSSDLHMNVT